MAGGYHLDKTSINFSIIIESSFGRYYSRIVISFEVFESCLNKNLNCHMSLFTIAKTWKQTKCPSIEEWIKKMYMHVVGYYSAIKKNEMMPLAAT